MLYLWFFPLSVFLAAFFFLSLPSASRPLKRKDIQYALGQMLIGGGVLVLFVVYVTLVSVAIYYFLVLFS